MIDGLVPAGQRFAARLLAAAATPVRVTSVRRSRTRQARLYRLFLAGVHPYPVAPPGRSAHEYGLAWDMVGTDAELRRLGALWVRMGGLWGGAFRRGYDPIHFELTARQLGRKHPALEQRSRSSQG